jgi:Ca2+-dependent lipid-binding protein
MARLEVAVVEATNLLQKTKLKNNSFIQIYLGNKKQKTRTIENSNNPKWNELFILYVYFLFLFFHHFCFD